VVDLFMDGGLNGLARAAGHAKQHPQFELGEQRHVLNNTS
jgi:hypothetical protein